MTVHNWKHWIQISCGIYTCAAKGHGLGTKLTHYRRMAGKPAVIMQPSSAECQENQSLTMGSKIEVRYVNTQMNILPKSTKTSQSTTQSPLNEGQLWLAITAGYTVPVDSDLWNRVSTTCISWYSKRHINIICSQTHMARWTFPTTCSTCSIQSQISIIPHRSTKISFTVLQSQLSFILCVQLGLGYIMKTHCEVWCYIETYCVLD